MTPQTNGRVLEEYPVWDGGLTWYHESSRRSFVENYINLVLRAQSLIRLIFNRRLSDKEKENTID